MRWPPKPGELWIAEDEWPTYGLSNLSGFIKTGDVFLVVEAGPVVEEELSPGKIELKDFKRYRSVELQVIVHGVKRMMVTECVDGNLDMNPLEQSLESSTI
jgi:hypothetical protein